MSTNTSFPRNTMVQAKQAAQGWKELEGRLNVPSMSLEDFDENITEAQRCTEIAEEYKIKRSAAIAERNSVLKEVWHCTKRIRNAAKAIFGDDSSEVEKMGIIPVTSRGRRATS